MRIEKRALVFDRAIECGLLTEADSERLRVAIEAADIHDEDAITIAFVAGLLFRSIRMGASDATR